MADDFLDETEDDKAIACVEAEAGLVGALLCQNKLFDQVADLVTEDDFFEPVHARLYRVISQLIARNEEANIITLKPYFEDDKALNDLGGIGYLVKITGSGLVMLGARGFAEQIAEFALRRRLSETLQIALDELRSPRADQSVSDITDRIEADLEPSAMRKSPTVEIELWKSMTTAIAEWEEESNSPQCVVVPSFDKGVGMPREGDLIVLAGRPGMGKTAAALSIARGYAENGHGTLILSREMRHVDLAERCICDASYDGGERIPYGAMTNRRLTSRNKFEAGRITDRMRDVPLTIIDTPSMKTGELSRRVKRWKRRRLAKGQTARVVIVDYLQLLDPDHKTSGQTEKISEVSMALKSIAKEHSVIVIALSQLSRAVEQRENKRPQMSDLRDSGQIEQDADAIVFLYRPYYYLMQSEPYKDDPKYLEWEQSADACRDSLEFIFAKVRKGETSTKFADFFAAYQAVRG